MCCDYLHAVLADQVFWLLKLIVRCLICHLRCSNCHLPYVTNSTEVSHFYTKKHDKVGQAISSWFAQHAKGLYYLQEAEEQLDEGQVGFIPEASAMTHKQVLEMAVAEASRRVHEATKYAHCTCLVCLHQGFYIHIYTRTYITFRFFR